MVHNEDENDLKPHGLYTHHISSQLNTGEQRSSLRPSRYQLREILLEERGSSLQYISRENKINANVY